MLLSSGDKIGQYEILAPIGAGGMGEVYRAKDLRLGREVAVKVLPAGMAHNDDRLARFQREARAVAALNHPHIVTIFSVEEAGGVHFLTMELVVGQALEFGLAWHVARRLPLQEWHVLGAAARIVAVEQGHRVGCL